MPYAYGATINHEYIEDYLKIWLTFKHQMLRSSDPTAVPPVYDIMPPLNLWLIEADEASVAAVASEWVDDFTLLLTSDTVASEPTGVTLAYDGPDPGLCFRWGKQIEPWGDRESFAGYPTTPAPHNSTHENGGSDEIQVDGLSGQLTDTQPSFVDRGDPASYDWLAVSFTTDGSWHELDLSTKIPIGTKAVLLKFFIMDDLTNQIFRFRKNGNANAIITVDLRTQVTNIAVATMGIVAVDTDRKIEYWGSNTTFTLINVAVSGWFL